MSALLYTGWNQLGLNTKDAELHAAVRDKDIARIQSLIAEGANVNSQDKNGNTPPHIAGMQFSIKLSDYQFGVPLDLNIVATLTQSGADPQIRNNASETYMSIMERKKKQAEKQLRRVLSRVRI